jgi:hypothetical protein
MVGAAGAVAAGFVLGWVGYAGLALTALVFVVATAALVPVAWPRRAATAAASAN